MDAQHKEDTRHSECYKIQTLALYMATARQEIAIHLKMETIKNSKEGVSAMTPSSRLAFNLRVTNSKLGLLT